MRLAIHQPEFMPWAGFFYKLALADLYISFDHVQFKKRYFENRNRIVSPSGEIAYISVPVKTKGKFNQPICDVEIDNTQRWKNKILRQIYHFYNKAPYFEKYFEDLKTLFNAKHYDKLLELNIDIINFFRKYLGIFTPMVSSSNMDVDTFQASNLILQICLLNRADVYLCGASGIDYLEQEVFKKNGICIEWLDYQPMAYGQLCDDFVSHMSTLDLLFNQGEKSFCIIMNRAKV